MSDLTDMLVRAAGVSSVAVLPRCLVRQRLVVPRLAVWWVQPVALSALCAPICSVSAGLWCQGNLTPCLLSQNIRRNLWF